VKRKSLMALVLAIVMLGVCTGCESQLTIPRIVTNTKQYNNQINMLIVSRISGSAPESFPQYSVFTIEDGLTCRVDYADANELDLSVMLDNWVADDGKQISGILSLDIGYYTSPAYISTLDTNQAALYFDRTSIQYATEILDKDASTEAFTPGDQFFVCLSLIVDGKPFITEISLRR
jgi:hypothetical protein